MFVPMQVQFVLMVQSILFGVIVGLFYDVLRAMRICFSADRWQVVLYDCIFWIVLLAALFEFNLVFAVGQSRFYVLVGASGGMVMYFSLFSGLVQPTLQMCLNAVIALWRIIVKMSVKLYNGLKQIYFAPKDKLFTKKFVKASSIFRKKGIK